MSDQDRMVPLGELDTRFGVVIPLHRDYEDLMIGSYRLTPDAAAVLQVKIREYLQAAAGYAERAHEDEAALPAAAPAGAAAEAGS